MSELFEKKNWIGEFWWEDKYENRFSQKLISNIITFSFIFYNPNF